MYPAEFDYYQPSSVAEAVSLLAAHDGAKLIAGGHSLLPVMKLRLATPGTLVDIGRISELRGISKEDGHYRIGALTTHAMIAAHRGLPRALSEAAGIVGDPQVRNRGTIGGNLAHADPASDLPTVVSALNAILHVTGPDGDRLIAASNCFTGLFTTAIGENELLTAVEVAAESERTGSGYVKLENPASRYALMGAAATVTLDLLGSCVYASVAIGGLTPCATVAPSVAAALVRHHLSDERIHEAAQQVAEDIGPDVLGDIHAGADYRRAMAPVFVERAIHKAAKRAGYMAKLGKWIEKMLD
jgi:carbon-monoxide dehydrogenase medium subunit